MINLIGCSKGNFMNLLGLMQYKTVKDKGKDTEFFSYKPKNLIKNNKKIIKKNKKDNAFEKLSELRIR